MKTLAVLLLYINCSCAIVKLTGDGQGHITGASYYAFARQYDATYEVDTVDGKKMVIIIGAKSELQQVSELLKILIALYTPTPVK